MRSSSPAGSAFGPGVADAGVMREVWHAAGLGWPVSPTQTAAVARVPIVPTAILDLGRGGAGCHNARPDGAAAYRAATDGPVVQGAVSGSARVLSRAASRGDRFCQLRSRRWHHGWSHRRGQRHGVRPDRFTGDLLRTQPGPRGRVRPCAVTRSRGCSGPTGAAGRRCGRTQAGRRRRGRRRRSKVVSDDDLTKTQCRKLAQVSHDGPCGPSRRCITAYDGD